MAWWFHSNCFLSSVFSSSCPEGREGGVKFRDPFQQQKRESGLIWLLIGRIKGVFLFWGDLVCRMVMKKMGYWEESNAFVSYPAPHILHEWLDFLGQSVFHRCWIFAFFEEIRRRIFWSVSFLYLSFLHIGLLFLVKCFYCLVTSWMLMYMFLCVLNFTFWRYYRFVFCVRYGKAVLWRWMYTMIDFLNLFTI